MEIKKYKNFINTYEKEIKDYRDKYYKNILQYSTNQNKYPTFTLYIIPIIIAIIFLLIFNFSVIGYIVSFLSVFITNYAIKVISKILKLEPANEYLEVIKRKGYHSIEEYEEKVRQIITGQEGYYQTLLNDLIQKYKIDETTRKVTSIAGEDYYYWTNQHRDKIMLLNTKTNKKPEVKTIKIDNIRYFRIDNDRKAIIINTSSENYLFKVESLDIFNEIIKEKRLENLKVFTPATYIDDFEIYMHGIKSEENKINQEKEKKISSYVNIIAITSICLGIIVTLSFIINKNTILFNIFSIVILSITSTNLRSVLSIKAPAIKTDNEYIKQLNNNPECIERFNELKFVLGIKSTYDSVYTPEGAEYKTWLANGYFHVFLNLIYFNTVYMSIKISDVAYYKKEGNECTVKLKDKTLVFTSDAENVFKKILPNKDYYWLKGYQNK